MSLCPVKSKGRRERIGPQALELEVGSVMEWEAGESVCFQVWLQGVCVLP